MPPKDLEGRVSSLENQVADLQGRVRASEHDAAAARVLAGGADRDVGEMRDEVRDFRRATVASFNAQRADVVDLRQEMRTKFDLLGAGQQKIVGLLEGLIDDRER